MRIIIDGMGGGILSRGLTGRADAKRSFGVCERGRVILKWMLQKYDVKVWTVCDREGWVLFFCECCSKCRVP
jgi:hypothetical protein